MVEQMTRDPRLAAQQAVTDAGARIPDVAVGVAVVRALENDAPHCHLLLRKRDQVMSRKIVFNDLTDFRHLYRHG